MENLDVCCRCVCVSSLSRDVLSRGGARSAAGPESRTPTTAENVPSRRRTETAAQRSSTLGARRPTCSTRERNTGSKSDSGRPGYPIQINEAVWMAGEHACLILAIGFARTNIVRIMFPTGDRPRRNQTVPDTLSFSAQVLTCREAFDFRLQQITEQGKIELVHFPPSQSLYCKITDRSGFERDTRIMAFLG